MTNELPAATQEKIKIGVSSCLLGNNVRYDGQHKYHWYINEVLNHYFEYIAVCPEVGAGMGTPRKAIRLVGAIDNPRAIEPKSGTDWTQAIGDFSQKQLKQLPQLSGFLFKKGSPSCGLLRTKVYQDNGIPLAKGQGIFAAVITQKWPLLPVEEEGRLNDARIRENFITRVFAYHRLQRLAATRFRRGDWVSHHQHSKFLLLSHSRTHYTKLGQMVAQIADYKAQDFTKAYTEAYMTALKIPATPKKHSDALMHILGFLKKKLDPKQKADIIQTIDTYRQGRLPLIVPITLLKHYITVFDVAYVKDQIYLNPHPDNLSLRNQI